MGTAGVCIPGNGQVLQLSVLSKASLPLVLLGVYFKLSLNSVMIPLGTSVDGRKQAY